MPDIVKDSKKEDSKVVEPASSKGKKRSFSVKTIILVAIVVISLGFAGFTYYQMNELKSQLSEKQEDDAAVMDEIDEITEKMKESVELPEGETPTLVTIEDRNEFTENDELFKDAQNGDKVLVFEKARKAYLFRPSSGKLINLAPINVLTDTGGSNSGYDGSGEFATDDEKLTPRLLSNVTVELRNGTKTQGLTYLFDSRLASLSLETEVAKRADAIDSDHQVTLVIPGGPETATTTEAVAERLGYEVAELPEGEPETAADVLIIIGTDEL